MLEICNFCGKNQDEVNKIIVGGGAGICNNCIDLCSGILSKQKTKFDQLTAIDPIELKEHLDKFIVSQDEAKKILSVAVANHFKRISSAKANFDKSNLMLLGPTGSGKTLLVKTLANYLHVPVVIADATRFTESGYVGDDVDSVLLQLLQKAGGDVKKAQHGIVFLDEIDKIAKGNKLSGKDVGNEGVQQSLLKLVEGATFTIVTNKITEATATIDTTNILFIASGAFVGIDKIKNKLKSATQIGFSASVKKDVIRNTEASDLIEFGLIPEFISRFPIIGEVEELTELDMLNILGSVENNLVQQYKHLFDYNDVKLSFDSDALSQVVSIAIAKKTGARGLRSIMEKALLPHMYNVSKYARNNINKVRITKSLITNPKEVKLT
jgi:ATP-dependent Clp protease ATP-binding subunit ClpX